jgi:hypothetical protein
MIYTGSRIFRKGGPAVFMYACGGSRLGVLIPHEGGPAVLSAGAADQILISDKSCFTGLI